MKIIQISSFVEESTEAGVFGLGDDQQIYFWSWSDGKWVVYKKDPEDPEA